MAERTGPKETKGAPARAKLEARLGTEAIFVASPEGFRGENAGRAPSMLIKELAQNAFDESPQSLEVEVKYDKTRKAVAVTVSDDVAGGVRDIALIFTIWGSDKQDSPTKRGRMGRGLKEVISVADEARIVTQNHGGLVFTRVADASGNVVWNRQTTPERRARGTSITAYVGLWDAGAVDEIVNFLRRMRPPQGVAFSVNGVPVTRATAAEEYEFVLPTVVYENTRTGRKALERRVKTKLELIPSEEPWIYEMGIPVEKLAFPYSIDVAQRIPLRDRRDTVTEAYRRELFAQLLNLKAATLDSESFQDEWVHFAAARADLLTGATKTRVEHAYTKGAAYATNRGVLANATGWHIPTIDIKTLPESIRDIVREVGTDARAEIEKRTEEASVALPPSKWTPDQTKTVELFHFVAAGVGKPCAIKLFRGKASKRASFAQGTQTLNLFVTELGAKFFKQRLAASTLHILIHELAHWEPLDEAHGFDFKMDSEEVAANIAAFVYAHHDEIAARWA